jgi:hypothetical protein
LIAAVFPQISDHLADQLADRLADQLVSQMMSGDVVSHRVGFDFSPNQRRVVQINTRTTLNFEGSGMGPVFRVVSACACGLAVIESKGMEHARDAT